MQNKAYIHTYPSPLGTLTLASDGSHITGLWIKGQQHFASTLEPDAQEAALPVFEEAAAWLNAYFAGKDPGKRPPLKPLGSPFRQAVWQELLKVPSGQTITYGDIARRLAKASGKPASPRAVGGAAGHNPISILIPCHRVLGRDGSLTGYAGGMEAKVKLLAIEGVNAKG